MAPIRACTFNVRCDTDEDDRPWAERASAVRAAIGAIDPDILAVQEALAPQYEDLRGALPDRTWHGVGRADGDRDGEFVPLAWRPERFDPVDSGVFWLSETPDRPSVGWDASLPRIATWATLADRDSGGELWAVSTHLDHEGRRSRRESAALLAERAQAQLEAGRGVVLMGDFNCAPASGPHATLREAGLVDAREAAPDPAGPVGTYHGFTGSPLVRIDYVWLSPGATVEDYRALAPREAGFRSDHVPVVVECLM